MSFATQIADAVVYELNNASFPQDFTASRVALPRTEGTALSSLTVSVLPVSVESSLVGRSLIEYRVTVQIGVQKKISNETSDVASLGELVDEIEYYMTKLPLSQCTDAQWRSSKNNPIYSADHLARHRTFTSVISLEYSLTIQK